MEYLNNRDGSNALYEQVIAAVLPIYYGVEDDFTRGSHYIFNINTGDGRSMQQRLSKKPNRYTYSGLFDNIDAGMFCIYRCEW